MKFKHSFPASLTQMVSFKDFSPIQVELQVQNKMYLALLTIAQEQTLILGCTMVCELLFSFIMFI